MAYYGAHVVIVPVYYPVVYYVPMQQNFYNQKRYKIYLNMQQHKKWFNKFSQNLF